MNVWNCLHELHLCRLRAIIRKYTKGMRMDSSPITIQAANLMVEVTEVSAGRTQNLNFKVKQAFNEESHLPQVSITNSDSGCVINYSRYALKLINLYKKKYCAYLHAIAQFYDLPHCENFIIFSFTVYRNVKHCSYLDQNLFAVVLIILS